MILPDDMFDSIVGCSSIRLEGRAAERRGQDRIRQPNRVHVIPMAHNIAPHPINAQVRDMSPEGIGLLLPRKLLPGDTLLIRLVSREMKFWVYCDVTRVERVADGLFVTGATYDRIVSPMTGFDSHAVAAASH
ncbi:MAG TPA: PilZ domain-containing protein [Tepidisphaeraceae bacterium]|jgi:hypothetical protein|nr:PilZ domain-containing protein [Tepidisphaeraceae bacterium]